jgi:hypothetical protein
MNLLLYQPKGLLAVVRGIARVEQECRIRGGTIALLEPGTLLPIRQVFVALELREAALNIVSETPALRIVTEKQVRLLTPRANCPGSFCSNCLIVQTILTVRVGMAAKTRYRDRRRRS